MEKAKEFNLQKKQAEKLIMIGGGILVVAVLLFVLLQENGMFALIMLLPAVILFAIGGSKFSTLNKRFKVEVLGDLVSKMVDDGQFIPDQGLPMHTVYNTEFLKRADRYHTEDYLSGSMEGVRFESSDVKLEEKHVRHTKNGTETYYETYFMGRIFVFDFNKSFDGYLQVLERGRPHSRRPFSKIKLESVAFNKKFTTYTTNDHSAFYVLTPHFMESLMSFEQSNKGNISFSFIDNLLYIGINNFKDTFELKLFREINEATFEEFKRELSVIKDVIHELKLNRNIFK